MANSENISYIALAPCDNSNYIFSDNIDDLIKSLKEASIGLFQWFDKKARSFFNSSNENMTD